MRKKKIIIILIVILHRMSEAGADIAALSAQQDQLNAALSLADTLDNGGTLNETDQAQFDAADSLASDIEAVTDPAELEAVNRDLDGIQGGPEN